MGRLHLSLGQQLLWRALLLLALGPLGLVLVAHLYITDLFDQSARRDLEARPAAAAGLASHKRVRFAIADHRGKVLMDTRGGGVLPVPLDLKLILTLLVIGCAPLLLFLPLIRRLRATFSRLSAQAQSIADGHRGDRLRPVGPRELDGLVEAFNAMSRSLDSQDERRRRLVADVSHELRSPMARLRALGETLARTPADSARHLAQLDAEIALMDRLVGDMLDAARLDAGAALHPERLAILDWAQDVFARNRMRIEQAGVTARVSLPGPAGWAEFDPQRMAQVVGVLVENSLAALQGRSDARVTLTLASTGSHWTLSVSDNGRGVAAADLPHIFERFYRVEAARNRSRGGAGLGLSIAMTIVQAHGGALWAESREGVGSVFLARLPREAANPGGNSTDATSKPDKSRARS